MENLRCQNGYGVESIDADSLILQSIAGLCVKGVAEDRAPYFHEKVRPLLGYMVEHLMDKMPAEPEVASVLWLLGRMNMPRELADVVGKWAETGIVEGPKFEAPKRSSTKSAKLKSALKECSIITPNGTHLCDEEERIRNSMAPLKQEERYRLIADTPIFQNLAESELQAIAKACELTVFLEGEEVLKNGAAGQGMHIVVKGQGKVSVSAEAGVVTAGDVLGDTAMVQGVPTSECVEACGGPLATLHLPALAFRALGLKKKIGTMHRKKGLKARDATRSDRSRRMSYQGSNVLRATNEDDLSMVTSALVRNDNLKEVLSLTEAQVEHVAREAYLTHFVAGEKVFEKGSHGHRFYIVQDGIFEVTDGQVQLDKKNPGTGMIQQLRTGDSFGELALLYNAPRAATVTCKKAGSCWVMARTTFKNCMWMKMEGRISEYAELIRSVDIFKDRVTPNSLANLCNALEERYFIGGETIVEQGAPADSFFVIFEGTVGIVKDGEEIRQLGRGHYFGERALLCSDVRSATVKAVSDRCTVLALDRIAFNFMLMQEDSSQRPHKKRSSTIENMAVDSQTTASPSASPSAAQAIMDSSYRPKAEKSANLLRKYGVHAEQHDKDKSFTPHVAKNSLVRIGPLGEGSFGSVTLERDPASGKLFALKRMSKAQIESENLRDAIINERTCLGLLNSDFIAKLVGTFRDSKNVYLLLEACFGGELFEVFENNSDFFGSEAHVQFYAACVALGLEHIHDMRIIYRDLKLENCLLSLNGYLKLTDMGIAKVCIGKTYTVCGTTDYFAPEVLRQTGHNRAVDWWALGVMIYIMMTGRSPFDAPDTMKIYRKIMKGFAKVTFPSDFPEQTISMIRALCQRNPEERLTMGNLGVQNFKDHPWYRGFVWKELQSLRMVAPYVPSKAEDDIVASVARKHSKSELEEEGDALGDDDDDESTPPASSWDDVFDPCYVFAATDTRVTSITSLEN
mmetsp:Transcript_109026/g.172231  ORF Transcript_109026/g.172231 Transcript_109026/m.172231 type:complete len:969 (-) Transcript_109026:36-2942(-)